MSNINSKYFWTTNFVLVDVTWSGVGAFGRWSVGSCLVSVGRLVGGLWQVVAWSMILRKSIVIIVLRKYRVNGPNAGILNNDFFIIFF